MNPMESSDAMTREESRSDCVTVILPYFNREDSLAAAVHSVLRQTHRDIVLVLVNDGSTDESREIARAIEDRRVMHVDADANLGQPGARNLGLSIARTNLIAFMDSDDEWLPTKLERQLQELRHWHDAGVNVSVLGCGWRYKGSADQKAFKSGPFDFQDMMWGVAGTGTPLLLVDRSRAAQDVIFDNAAPALIERHYILGCLRNESRLAVVPEVLAVVTRGRSDHVANPRRAARAWEFYLDKYSAEMVADPDLMAWYRFRASREFLIAGDRGNALRHARAALRRKPLVRGFHLLLGSLAGAKGFAIAQRLTRGIALDSRRGQPRSMA